MGGSRAPSSEPGADVAGPLGAGLEALVSGPEGCESVAVGDGSELDVAVGGPGVVGGWEPVGVGVTGVVGAPGGAMLVLVPPTGPGPEGRKGGAPPTYPTGPPLAVGWSPPLDGGACTRTGESPEAGVPGGASREAGPPPAACPPGLPAPMPEA
ncbi:MAG: hypothetical protein HOV83_27470 [Catenulispora sp.]|nr:hypothetical protein [Catenulispora sp.]